MRKEQKSNIAETFPLLTKNGIIDTKDSGEYVYLNCLTSSISGQKKKGEYSLAEQQNELHNHYKEIGRERRKEEARYPYLQ